MPRQNPCPAGAAEALSGRVHRFVAALRQWHALFRLAVHKKAGQDRFQDCCRAGKEIPSVAAGPWRDAGATRQSSETPPVDVVHAKRQTLLAAAQACATFKSLAPLARGTARSNLPRAKPCFCDACNAQIT